MPATRSRTSTEAPEVAVEDKKTEATEPQNEPEVSETEVTDEKTDCTDTKTDSTCDEKPVDNSENGVCLKISKAVEGETADNGAAQVENGSKRKSAAGDEALEAPDSTDITPKKAKLDVAVDDESTDANNGSGEKIDSTPVETTA